MRFLLDTNILIALEPSNEHAIEPGAAAATEVARRIQETGNSLVMHPASWDDVDRDENGDRRRHRTHALGKYPVLPAPPIALPLHIAVLGEPEPRSNDWVDDQLLVAVARSAVDWLVTQDQRIHQKAQRLGIADRVLTLADALHVLLALYEKTPLPPPAVRQTPPHNLDESDPIFDSFRADYPGFDAWLQRCKRDRRPSWVIDAHGGRLAALCIAKPETDAGIHTLKICSFKVGDAHLGARFGELLLKTVFTYALDNTYQRLYVTVFPKHVWLVNLFQEFGFQLQPALTELGELKLVKTMAPSDPSIRLSAVEFAIRFGPGAWLWDGVQTWIVPIQPRYDDLLFPDRQEQRNLFPGRKPEGNALRKAYLCRSPLRRIAPGDVLCFYRSESSQSIRSMGVVESVLVSSRPDELSRFVGRRTVYSMEEITEMSLVDGNPRDVLAILFRQVLHAFPEVTLNDLLAARALKGPPQSITEVKKENLAWLIQRIRP